MPVFSATLLWRIAPYAAIALALLAGWLYVDGLQDKVEDQRVEIAALRTDLATERFARERDNAAQTALIKGLAQVSVEGKKDQAILRETIKDVAAPTSPQLGDFLRKLRESDSQGGASTSAGKSSR